MAQRLEIKVGQAGYDSLVTLDGQDVMASRAVIVMDAGEDTRVELTIVAPGGQPMILRGRFIPDDDE